MKLTIKTAKALVKSLGFTLNKNQYGEYVLRGEGVEYFAGDLADAVGTAEAITGKLGWAPNA